jgi:hypothetical protein
MAAQRRNENGKRQRIGENGVCGGGMAASAYQ